MKPHHSDSLCIVNSDALRHARSILLSNPAMKLIGEIRRLRLDQLKTELNLTWAELNRKLERAPRDSTLSQLWHQAPDSKTGKPRQMGDKQARKLEEVFKKPLGWMDLNPDREHAPLVGESPPTPYGEPSLGVLRVTVSVSPRAASIASRLDDLPLERQAMAFALVDVTLQTIEAEQSSTSVTNSDASGLG